MSTFLNKIFGKKTTQTSLPPADKPTEEPTVPISTGKIRQRELVPPQFLVGCSQSVGMQRNHNEDAIFTIASSMTSDSNNNMPFGLFIVADGMGGHQHGEQASLIAVRALSSYALEKLTDPIFSPNPSPPTESIQEIMHEGIAQAHRAIMKEVQGGGTTLTAVLLRGDQMTIAHIGDSRAYAIQADGVMQVLTRDHSLVKRLVELGQITEQEAAVHPQRNVLYRALGQGEGLDADISTFPAPQGGYLLVCSDGLWGVVPEEVISFTVKNGGCPQDSCDILIEAANQAGGPDNISVILVRMPG